MSPENPLLVGEYVAFGLRWRSSVVLPFAASPGVGKSTLAAALVARGHALLADDVTGLVPAAGGVRVLPAFPRLRLWADPLPAADRRQRVRRNLEKYWMPAARFGTAPQPVCAAFALESHNRPDFDVEPIPASRELLARAVSAPRPEDGDIDEVRLHAPHFAKTYEAYRGPDGAARFSRISTAGWSIWSAIRSTWQCPMPTTCSCRSTGSGGG